jgi:Glycosyltransferase family 87
VAAVADPSAEPAAHVPIWMKLRWWAPVLAVLGIGFASLLTQASTGDYGSDAGPAIAALIGGHLHTFFAVQPLMGSFSVLVRAPFALAAKLAGGSQTAIYDAGVIPCVLAACALAVGLVRLRERPRDLSLLLIALLAVLTPASRDAVRSGHPEEILAGALCVGAILLAGRRAILAGVLLGLAVATKQWALLAVAPVILAAPRERRIVLTAVAAVVGAILTVPLIAGNDGAFAHISHQAATAPATTTRATIWFLLARPDHIQLHLPPGFPTEITIYHVPVWIAQASHPLIILLPLLLALVVWRRRGDPLALLTLALLLRCVLDPVDNEYYHAPFLLALLAYETVARRGFKGIPVTTLFSAAGLWLTFDMLDVHGASPHLTNAVYLLWTMPVTVYLLRASRLLPSFGRRLSRARTFLPEPVKAG